MKVLVILDFSILLLSLKSGTYNARIFAIKLPSDFILGFSKSQMINTYFLNKHFSFLKPICHLCPEIECLLAENDYKIPDNFTICVR